MLEVEDITVVVPVHDEVEGLAHCLSSIERAARAVELPVRVIAVLDTCTDCLTVALTDEEREAKRRAVACFASQVRPLSSHPADAAVLPTFVIDRLVTACEMVFR